MPIVFDNVAAERRDGILYILARLLRQAAVGVWKRTGGSLCAARRR